MIKKTSISVLLSSIIMALSSNIAIAVEKTGSSSPIAAWPLILFFVVIIVFRKKIFAEATPEPEHNEPAVEQKTVKPEAVKKEAPKEVAKKEKPAKKPASKAKASASSTIDLTDDGEQCQASTAKGSRCKRTTTLESTTITIDDKTYKLTVCSQHNNDKLKIFSELIK